MAVTTSYGLVSGDPLDLAFTTSAMDITGLAGGGLAGLGDYGGHVDATFFDGGLADVGGSQNITGLNGSLDQLTNGNVVIVTEVAGAMSLRITTDTGGLVLADTSLGEDDTTALDVAALTGGGFVIATQDSFTSGTDFDVELKVFTAAGGAVDTIVPDSTLALDKAPAVAGLVDGGFAVAWTRDLGGGVTEGWHAIYNADGSVRLAAEVQDSVGDVNTGMSIVGLNDGGYAIAYQDSGWETGSLEITLARFDAAGVYQDETRVSDLQGDDTDAAVALLSNGMIAVTWSNDYYGDDDAYAQIVDPADGSRLLAPTHTIVNTVAEEFDSAAAGWGLAGLAVSLTGAADDVLTYQLKRTTIGDSAANVVAGDDAVDSMEGGGGGDSLSGMANGDDLSGQAGNDTLNGGDGDDSLLGGDNADVLIGAAGVDTLFGDAGADSLNGGGGDDYAFGGFGPDTMVGGTGGGDVLDFIGLPGETFLDLGFSGPQNTHSGGLDRIIGFELVFTGAGDDRVLGSGQDNYIETREGADTVKAADGADRIYGGGGADRLTGGGGDDEIGGEGGRDVMRGGFGADDFGFLDLTDSGVGVGLCDVIRDFNTSQGDRIDLTAVADGELAFIGADAFSGSASEVRVETVMEGQLVQVDADGDGASDMDILVRNSGLAGGAADFVL